MYGSPRMFEIPAELVGLQWGFFILEKVFTPVKMLRLV